MAANEEPADSEAPGIEDPAVFRLEYTKIIAHYYRLRKVVETDFKRMILHLKEARELTRSDSLYIINELLDYLEQVVPELKKLRTSLAEQMGEVADYIDGQEGTVEEIFKASPRFF